MPFPGRGDRRSSGEKCCPSNIQLRRDGALLCLTLGERVSNWGGLVILTAKSAMPLRANLMCGDRFLVDEASRVNCASLRRQASRCSAAKIRGHLEARSIYSVIRSKTTFSTDDRIRANHSATTGSGPARR
jgi:hypothetical protein